MKRVVGWHRLDTAGAEYAEIQSNPGRLEGDLVFAEDGTPHAVSYRIDCDDEWQTTRALIRLKWHGVLALRTLARSPDGSWTMDDRPMPQLAGVSDVDLSVTPSTNTLPVNRLQLEVGAHAEVTAAWVTFPSLDVVPLRQIYRRVGQALYEYEVPDLGYRADLTIDDDGVVLTYGAMWARLP